MFKVIKDFAGLKAGTDLEDSSVNVEFRAKLISDGFIEVVEAEPEKPLANKSKVSDKKGN